MKRKITAIFLVVALALSLGLMPAASVGASPGVIWSIGDIEPIPPNSSGDCNDEFKTSSWSGIESWTYNVDESVVVQNPSTFPSQLYILGFTGNTSRGVHEVTIEFTLPHWYYDVELEYARLGAETNQVTLDGGTPVSLTGPGEGSQTSHILSLGNLAQGDHEIVIACSDAAGAPGNHYVDAVKLTGSPLIIEKELVSSNPELTPDSNGNGVDEVPINTLVTFTMDITVTNDTPVTLNNILVQDNLGGDLKLFSTDVDIDGSPVDNVWLIPSAKKNNAMLDNSGEITVWWTGKTKKVHLLWNIPSLAPGGTATLTLVVQTDTNPGKGKNAPHQEYTSADINDLNSGATIVSVQIGDDVIEVGSQTPPIQVESMGEEDENDD